MASGACAMMQAAILHHLEGGLALLVGGGRAGGEVDLVEERGLLQARAACRAERVERGLYHKLINRIHFQPSCFWKQLKQL